MTNLPADISKASAAESNRQHRSGGVRSVCDALVSLSLAVMLVRTFAVEGYMISTGSMAPTLPGFHKRVVCPACGYEFAVGVTDGLSGRESAPPSAEKGNFEEDSGPPDSIISSAASRSVSRSRQQVVCPNCGCTNIDLAVLPVTQGDQLLVYKDAYLFRAPHRWEVVVFRNPMQPTQAYVKRVVGLPGETIELKGGDVWANGTLQRKNLTQQNSIRILVYDHNFAPQQDENWQPRWVPADEAWQSGKTDFVYNPAAASASSSGSKTNGGGTKNIRWVTYRHWIRSGGTHKTAVRIPPALQSLDFTFPSLYPVRYDAGRQELWVRGVLREQDRQRVAASYHTAGFAELIGRLAERSHLSPVTDEYGYNRRRSAPREVVRDLMWEGLISVDGMVGRFAVEMTDGKETFRLTYEAESRRIALWRDGSSQPVAQARLKREVTTRPFRLSLSLFDRQVTAAVNGFPVFPSLPLSPLPEGTPPPLHPVRFGAAGLSVRVSDIRLFRDVFYTRKSGQDRYVLGQDEFFMLGDNSPISADSRIWGHAGVPRFLLLGKPFLVHLPSRPGQLRMGQRVLRVRIPDIRRIRYIR